jgi:hypothetical protein
VGCPGTDLRIDIQEQATTASTLEDVDTYCYKTPDGGAVDAATVAPDARRYATALAVAKPTIRSWPPGGVTLVHLPTYFAARAQGSGQATVGGAGYSLQLAVAPQSYVWHWGDGATLTTTDPGAGPPDGAVRHTYPQAGTDDVTVTVSYGATYRVVTPFGTFGPEVVPGGAVRTLPAADGIQVRQAIAGLTS